jgi:hypothetical protein
MQLVFRTLSLVLVAACPLAQAAHEEVVGAGVHRSELRDAVQFNLGGQVARVQREDALAGRHLNPAERAQLRQQVRRQWVESRQSERVTSVPATATPVADAQPGRVLSGAPQGQRP